MGVRNRYLGLGVLRHDVLAYELISHLLEIFVGPVEGWSRRGNSPSLFSAGATLCLLSTSRVVIIISFVYNSLSIGSLSYSYSVLASARR